MTRLFKKVSQAIDARRNELAANTVALEFAARPELEQRYGILGREKCMEDAKYHLAYLAEAIAAGDPGLFSDYVAWAKVMLAQRDIPADDLARHLGHMRAALQSLPDAESAVAIEFVTQGLQGLSDWPNDVPSFLSDNAPHGSLARQYLEALLAGDRQTASRLVLDATEQGVGVKEIYLHVFEPAQHEIGRLWQLNEVSVAQEHFCTAATQMVMSQLYPLLFAAEKGGGSLVATCVQSEMHEIGVRMVADFFEMEGWDTYYLGASTPTQSVVNTLIERKAHVLGISASMTYHLRAVTSLIEAVRAADACREVKILVGGYPFNVSSDLWKKIGADGYACSAQEAIELAAGFRTSAAATPETGP